MTTDACDKDKSHQHTSSKPSSSSDVEKNGDHNHAAKKVGSSEGGVPDDLSAGRTSHAKEEISDAAPPAPAGDDGSGRASDEKVFVANNAGSDDRRTKHSGNAAADSKTPPPPHTPASQGLGGSKWASPDYQDHHRAMPKSEPTGVRDDKAQFKAGPGMGNKYKAAEFARENPEAIPLRVPKFHSLKQRQQIAWRAQQDAVKAMIKRGEWKPTGDWAEWAAGRSAD